MTDIHLVSKALPELSVTKHLKSYLLGKNIIMTISLITVTILAALSETFTIGLLLPILSIILGDAGISIPFIEDIIDLVPLSLFSGNEITRILAIYLTIVISAALLRVFHLYILNYASFKVGAQISLDLFTKVLFCKYENSKELSTGDTVVDLIPRVNSIVYGIILPSLTIVTHTLILSTVLLFTIFTFSTLLETLIACIALTFTINWFLTKKKLNENGRIVSEGLRGAAETATETIRNKKTIELSHNYSFYLESFVNHDKTGKLASARTQILIGIPRYIVEVVIAGAMVFYVANGTANSIDLDQLAAELAISVIVLARMFPLIQSIYRSIGLMKTTRPILVDAFKLLELSDKTLPIDTVPMIQFDKSMELRDILFKYKSHAKGIGISSVKIKKGEKIILTGPSGIGKTTFIDIFMGLIQPQEGAVVIDGLAISGHNLAAWQKKIAHVEQSFYVSNRSTLENIFVGDTLQVADNIARAKYLCAELGLDETIMKLPKQYNEPLGEGGSKMSGGERQRLVIARALYENPEVMFFDEATSALDYLSKVKVYKLIEKEYPHLTLVSITHDHREIEFFDRTIDFSDILDK